MKNKSTTIGVRSADLHRRVKAYVDALNDENVTISTVVRDAVKEKIAKLEREIGSGITPAELAAMVAKAKQGADADELRQRKAKRCRPTSSQE